MASNTEKVEEKKVEEKREIKVKALLNLKYDKDIVKINKEFLIRESDSEGLVKAGYIEIIK